VKRAAGSELHAFLGAFSPEIAQIALRLRTIVLGEAKGASEFSDDADGDVAMAYALTENPADAFCRLAVHGDRVDLEFGLGSQLPDPERRLAGKGKRIRHLRMASLDDLRQPFVGRFLRAAIKAAPQPEGKTGKRSDRRPVVRGVHAKKRPPDKAARTKEGA
jgi:hypothetical protein